VDLEDVLRDLAPRLIRYASGKTGDRDLGEDVAQDALAALVRRWRQVGPPASPEAFVFAIARRRAWRATVKRRLLVPLGALPERADARHGPEEEAVAAADGAATRRALGCLPRAEREALLLVAAGGLRTAEAARVLGIAEGALRMRLHRGRQRLAALLGGRYAGRS
jgi:RNA polymerase sigma-70 factor (ECF subfamily)